jgi:hypothetical protein
MTATFLKRCASTTVARLFVVALVTCNLRLIRAAEMSEYLPPESGMRQHPVALEKFVQLRAGMKRGEVEKLLAKRGEHQFTYKDGKGIVWHNFEYSVAQEPRYASSGFDLLYKDGSLYAIIDYMDDWNRLKEFGAAPVQIKDPVKRTERYILEFFRVKALRGDDMAGSMGELKKHILNEEREHKARNERNPPDPGLTFIITAYTLLTPFQQAELRRAYKTNAEYMAKFDGGKVAIGMTEAQVRKIFGEPLLNDKLSDVEHVTIYGPSDTKAIEGVQAYLACRPVAMLFHNGAAVRVMSNWYCDVDWRDRVWPELKSPQRRSKE